MWRRLERRKQNDYRKYTVLDNKIGLYLRCSDGLFILSCLLTGVFAMCSLAIWIEDMSVPRNAHQVLWRLLIIFLSVAFVSGWARIFTPTTKELALIKAFPAISNSAIAEHIRADFGDIYKMAIDCAKDTLKEKQK